MSKKRYRFLPLENNDEEIQGNERAPKIRRSNEAIEVGYDDKNPHLNLVSEFLKNANEDILLEIFLRLPNCQSAILVGSVCHHCHSVISMHQFIPRFLSLHQDKPYTILFRRGDSKEFTRPHLYKPFCKLSSLHGKDAAPSSYLDFMPSPMIVRASFNDLLLLSSGSRWKSKHYYICNPVTKCWFELPDIVPSKMTLTGFALVCMPNCGDKLGSSTNAQYLYKVALIQRPQVPREGEARDHCLFSVTIFCSKSRHWSQSWFSFPLGRERDYRLSINVVTCNGILYWLDGDVTKDRIIALDLFRSRCGVIHFPDDFGRLVWARDYDTVHLGVVGQELRLLKLCRGGFGVKVWELNYKDFASTSWVLVYQIIKWNRPNTKQLVTFAFHPINGDVVFMIWGKRVFQYRILENRCEMVDELQGNVGRFPASITILHPSWPTPVPSH